MRRAARLFAAVSVVLLPTAACSLLVDTSGLATDVAAQGDGSPSTPDASRDSPTSSVTDGATPSDGAGPSDAGDAGTDALDSSAPSCTPGATTICDDFDEPTPPAAGWLVQKDRGAIAFDAVGLSLPHAFEAKILAGSGSADAYIGRSYPAPRNNVRCELDMKLIDVPGGEIDVIDLITPVPGAADYHVYLGWFGGSWSIAEFQGRGDGGSATVDRTSDLTTPLPLSTWFHVVFEQSGTSVTVNAGGATAMLSGLSLPASGNGTSVSFGISYAAGQVQSADVVFDNVACTVLP